MGRQYVRQSFSSASCAAGDSPCASSTTLQCVVANTAAPFSHLRPVGPIPLPEAPPSLADTVAIQGKSHPKIKIIGASANLGTAQSDSRAIQFAWQKPRETRRTGADLRSRRRCESHDPRSQTIVAATLWQFDYSCAARARPDLGPLRNDPRFQELAAEKKS